MFTSNPFADQTQIKPDSVCAVKSELLQVSTPGGNLPDRPVSGLRLRGRSCYFAPRALAARA